MNIQKRSFRAIICMCLVLCTMVSVMVFPAFAAENDTVVYIAEVDAAGIVKSMLDYLGADPSLYGDQYENLEGFVYDTWGSSVAELYATENNTVLVSEEELVNCGELWYEFTGDSVVYDFDQAYYSIDGMVYYAVATSPDYTVVPDTSTQYVATPVAGANTDSDTGTKLSNVVNSDMLSGILGEIIDLLPIVIVVIIGFVGLRKAIGFIRGVLHNG